jgi:hypothetical protein
MAPLRCTASALAAAALATAAGALLTGELWPLSHG